MKKSKKHKIPPRKPRRVQYSKNDSGYVGIGTTSPTAKLDVIGEVKVGTTGLTCATGTAGAIRYNNGNLEYCNGTGWVDTTPSGTSCGMRLAHCSGANLFYDNGSTASGAACKGNTLTTSCNSGYPTGTVGCPTGYTGMYFQGGQNGASYNYLLTCIKN